MSSIFTSKRQQDNHTRNSILMLSETYQIITVNHAYDRLFLEFLRHDSSRIINCNESMAELIESLPDQKRRQIFAVTFESKESINQAGIVFKGCGFISRLLKTAKSKRVIRSICDETLCDTFENRFGCVIKVASALAISSSRNEKALNEGDIEKLIDVDSVQPHEQPKRRIYQDLLSWQNDKLLDNCCGLITLKLITKLINKHCSANCDLDNLLRLLCAAYERHEFENEHQYYELIFTEKKLGKSILSDWRERGVSEIAYAQKYWKPHATSLSLRGNNQSAFIVIDLDRFGQINRKSALTDGDNAIKLAAKSITESIDKSGFVYHRGGDEFFCILPEANEILVKKLANEIVKNVRHTFSRWESSALLEYPITASVGLCITNDCIDATSAIKHAEDEQKKAKITRNCYSIYKKGEN